MTIAAVAVALAPAASAASERPFGVKVKMSTTGPAVEVLEDLGEVRRFENPQASFTQAGSHPYALTTSIEFPTEVVGRDNRGEPILSPTGDPRDIVTDLPAGFLGDPQAVPQCPLVTVLDRGEPCPAASQIGVAVVHLGAKESIGPIVNLTPEAGQSAEFGIVTPYKFTYLLTGHVVRSGSSYGLTIVSNRLPVSEVYSAELTFWGVPAESSHDFQRGLTCQKIELLQICSGGHESSGDPETPFLTMPADCTAGALSFTFSADSWEKPGDYKVAQATLPPVTGCNLLQFGAAIGVEPDTPMADEPVGLGVNVAVPQVESREANATPQLRNSVVTLPEGMSISPGIVDGIRACNESGPEGINLPGANPSPEFEEIGLNGEPQLAPGHCPDASIVGSAEAETPLLGTPIKGHIYLAKPLCGGPGERACTEEDALDGNLYQLYLELGGVGPLSDTGVNIKVRGKTEANPATGQLTAVFENTPELPFSELRIRLNGGPRAPLDTPAVCGPAVTTADFTPWSAPGHTLEGALVPGTPDSTSMSYFNVQGCSSPPGLNPGFLAGTVTPQAGGYSAFTLNLTRNDREQYVKGIQVHTPPGLLGMLSSVTLCGEAQANSGQCPETSKIGTTSVASGAGTHPFEIGGDVYLTGPYGDAPFGLSIVVHVVAGPFNLGVVVVRARIAVDPQDSTLTVTTDETGPHAVPQIVFGVPVRLKRITVDIDRPGFMFNPTNCDAQRITAVVSGAQDATAAVSSPFAVGGCKSLAFKPHFTAQTNAHTSRKDGASLDVKLSFPTGSVGSEANVAKAKVSLPKQLPSRLTTLQKACPAATFDNDPAACPPGAIVGIVKASTPVLPVGLSGPVYFVSHGGAGFPSLVVVLQGDGVRVDLTGTTFINKQNVTSNTFETVPDVPVNSFELFLPEGRDSALAAIGSLCKQKAKLVMPTIFIAQNGTQIKQNTKIEVTGCPSSKTSKKKGRTAK